MRRATGGVVFIMIKDATGISALSERRHCQWRISLKTPPLVVYFLKYATDSSAFASCQQQWRAAIHKFKNIFLSFLFLIILLL
jgi:hypothetical protein